MEFTSGILATNEFYTLLLEQIDIDLASKGLAPKDLRDTQNEYIISQRQYYNIKSISKGNNASKLSHSRLKDLCDYLKIDYETKYDVTKIDAK